MTDLHPLARSFLNGLIALSSELGRAPTTEEVGKFVDQDLGTADRSLGDLMRAGLVADKVPPGEQQPYPMSPFTPYPLGLTRRGLDELNSAGAA